MKKKISRETNRNGLEKEEIELTGEMKRRKEKREEEEEEEEEEGRVEDTRHGRGG